MRHGFPPNYGKNSNSYANFVQVASQDVNISISSSLAFTKDQYDNILALI